MGPRIHDYEPLVYLTFLRLEERRMDPIVDNFSLDWRNLFKRLKEVDGTKEIWYLRDEVYQSFEVDMFAVIECAETTAMESVHELLEYGYRYPGRATYAMKEWFTIPMKEKDFEDLKRPHESVGETVLNMQLLDYSGLEQQAIDQVEDKLQEFFESRHHAGFTFDRIEARWTTSQKRTVVIFGPTPEEAERDQEENVWEFEWAKWVSDMGWEIHQHRNRHVAGHFYMRPLPM
ncbi:hypothetical protein RJZ56_001631 [Blastomyces dermatitidis]|uniref:Uncharacterized protein n=2 Tax=Ajellomyces dermatitidis TaxID=5039 RepID=F2T6R8_AJEDA|nr:uncharacterized protein BDCG_05900 [Blastomyces dermatitidis ER-3]EEQ90780.1 hypothetical protein BDCG_05900 [Blastomyces dermatitidis ER-3]EGE78882.1 hypothetical protein BDDG_01819 [Blastomyces dermatitidis ATCC 18188]EQL36613.1 hypothetical protein BDFG_01982 [Blastomyces dermatitidis ATCC 26199]EQL36614.1 hypothetical protein, variant [Blastomyces dermatitidis ATCC 26199]